MKRLRVCGVPFVWAAVLLFGVSSASQAVGQGWTGSWATSPERAGSGRSFQRQTLRQIVHTSIGGHAARLHISNVFGVEPLRIKDVHIARRSTGSAIVPGTDRATCTR